MLNTINRYTLNDAITKEDLLKAGFNQSETIKAKLTYYKELVQDINLVINVFMNDNYFLFSDEFDIQVINDELINYPFCSNSEIAKMDEFIFEYNKTMDELKEKGIFKTRKLSKK